MREVPKKNYLITLLIFVAIVILTITLSNIYKNQIRKTSIMYNYLSEIKNKDLSTYLLEKPNIIIYISDKYDISKEKLEEKLKRDMINYNISDYFVFLNIDQNNLEFIDQLNKKYTGNIDKKIPTFIVFEEGKIKKYYSDLENINLAEITRHTCKTSFN